MPIGDEFWVGYYGRRAETARTAECEGCARTLPLTAFDCREWVRLGPLPVFPLWAWRFLDVCPLCGHGRRMRLSAWRAVALDEARPERDALDVEPFDQARRLALAWKLHTLGLMVEALAVLAPVLAQAEAPAAFHHCAGVQHRALGQTRLALAALETAVAQAPDEPLYRLDLARSLLRRRGGLALAVEQLLAATQLAPDLAQAWVELAEARTLQHDTAGAQAAWIRAVQLQPELRQNALYRGIVDA